MEAVMDEMRQQVNEELMDGLGGRVDDLERRLAVLLELLKEEKVCKAIGLHPLQLERATPSDAPMMFRRARHENLRHKTLKEHREKAVIERLARVSPERLDELIRGV